MDEVVMSMSIPTHYPPIEVPLLRVLEGVSMLVDDDTPEYWARLVAATTYQERKDLLEEWRSALTKMVSRPVATLVVWEAITAEAVRSRDGWADPIIRKIVWAAHEVLPRTPSSLMEV